MLDYGIDSMTLKLILNNKNRISTLSDFAKSAVLFYKAVESN